MAGMLSRGPFRSPTKHLENGSEAGQACTHRQGRATGRGRSCTRELHSPNATHWASHTSHSFSLAGTEAFLGKSCVGGGGQ